MPVFKFDKDGNKPLKKVSFKSAGIVEKDLQDFFKENIGEILPEVMVVSEEFSNWEDNACRIDLLAIDRQANLVVIELKRTEDAGHAELQAIRYAAMVSTLTIEEIVPKFAEFLKEKEEDARNKLKEFLDWEELDESLFGLEVKIVLVSADYSAEITSSILWLNENGLDITCIRFVPHECEGRDNFILVVETIIPLPEAQDYMVLKKIKGKKSESDRQKWPKSYFNVIVNDVLIVDDALLRRAMLALITNLVGMKCQGREITPESLEKCFNWPNSKKTFFIADESQDIKQIVREWQPKERSWLKEHFYYFEKEKVACEQWVKSVNEYKFMLYYFWKKDERILFQGKHHFIRTGIWPNEKATDFVAKLQACYPGLSVEIIRIR